MPSSKVPPTNGVGLGPYYKQFVHLPRSADIAREALRAAIMDGNLSPGTTLQEERLAKELSMSRTPIREALQQLRNDGLVELGAHQSAIVSTVTTDDILAIYLVREVLEGLVARLAAWRATPEHHEAMLAILRNMDAAAEEGKVAELVKLNLLFHARLRQIVENRYLNQFLEQVEYAVKRFGNTTYSYPGRDRASIAEHRAIIEAILAQDADRAEALATQHMRNARQVRLQMRMEGR